MNDVFERYLHPSYAHKYKFTQGPNMVRSHEDARRGGTNCVAFAHLVLKDMFGELLPERLKCYEMYMDQERFEDVDSTDVMQAGDLVWFGLANPDVSTKEFDPNYLDDGHLENWSDFPIRHVGVFTGEIKEGDPMILHSTWSAGTVIWPLRKFREYDDRYAEVYAIRRFRGASARTQSECSAQQFATL